MNLESMHNDAYFMPSSFAKVEAIKAGIRIADQLGDVNYGFKFRRELIDDAAFDGRFSDVRDAFGAMGWILRKIDEELVSLDIRQLIDKEQWICRWIIMYPEITIEQIDRLLDDLKRRLSGAGLPPRYYHEAVMIAAAITDRPTIAAEAYEHYRKGSKDWFVDCDDCIDCRIIKYLRYAGRHEEAFKVGVATPFPGYCNMNPKTSYNELLASAVENEKLDGIEIYQQRAYKMIAQDQFFLEFIGYHLQYYAKVDTGKGKRLYEKHLPWIYMPNRFPLALYDFHMGAAMLLKTIAAKRKTFKAKLDSKFALYNAEDTYNAAELADYHYKTAAEIAAQFDKRNGTEYYARKLMRLARGA